MSDFVQVILVGNLKHDIQTKTDRETGMVYGSSVLCVGKTSLVQGEPVTRTMSIPIEIHGQSRVSRFKQQFGAGSRMLCQGTLTQGDHPAAGSLRVVVETVFTADTEPGSREQREAVGSRSRTANGPGTGARARPDAGITDAGTNEETDEVWRIVWGT